MFLLFIVLVTVADNLLLAVYAFLAVCLHRLQPQFIFRGTLYAVPQL